MKTITIADTTLCRENKGFSFKEKIEIAKLLEKMGVDVIEISEIGENKADTLFVRTVASFIKNSIISVAAGHDKASIEKAISALSTVKKARVRIELSVSPVGMEYSFHKKPEKMLDWISTAVALAKEKIADVEFCALDATRADEAFLYSAIKKAEEAGATVISICDNASELFPDDFSEFAKKVSESTALPIGIYCDNRNGLACAAASLSVKSGISFVKTAVSGSCVDLETFAGVIKNCGENYGVKTNISKTEVNRTVEQIRWIFSEKKSERPISSDSQMTDAIHLDAKDTKETVIMTAEKLGYELSDEDCDKVYEEFLRVAAKKNVGARELEVIIATSAFLQVPTTYKLVSYVVNDGNIISPSAQITLERDGKLVSEISMGDGPVDAAVNAIEKIVGRHFELDDFQIQSVTEGTEAMGTALVKLRSDGKLFSGSGVSTGIIGAGIKAFISAVNKIIYEEENL